MTSMRGSLVCSIKLLPRFFGDTLPRNISRRSNFHLIINLALCCCLTVLVGARWLVQQGWVHHLRDVGRWDRRPTARLVVSMTLLSLPCYRHIAQVAAQSLLAKDPIMAMLLVPHIASSVSVDQEFKRVSVYSVY